MKSIFKVAIIICVFIFTHSHAQALIFMYDVDGYETVGGITTNFTGKAILDANDGVLIGNGLGDTNFDELFNSFSIQVMYEDDVEIFNSMWYEHQFDNGLIYTEFTDNPRLYHNWSEAMEMYGRDTDAGLYITPGEGWYIAEGSDVASSFDDWTFVGWRNDLSELEYTLTNRSEITEPVPEPATILLLGTGIAGLFGYSRRRKLKK